MSNQHTPPISSTIGNAIYLFLSYNSLDQRLVRDIQKSLSIRGIDTFVDRDCLKPGLPWVNALQEGINNSRAAAVFIGKEGLGAWQKREMELALQRQAQEEKLKGSFPVVPVLLPGADVEKAPGFLLLNTWVDLRGGINDIGLDMLAQVVRGNVISTRPIVGDTPSPYRALLAFREEDARLFYGREIFAEKLLKKTLTHQLVAVVGPSGSGKSSIVQAGLFPLLRRETTPSWEVILFTPGNHPFHSFAAALLPIFETDIDKTRLLIRAGELGESWKNGVPLEIVIKQILNGHLRTDRLLICIDQFEELFTLTPETERLPFLNALLELIAAAPTTLLLTLRADFYSQAISLSRDLSDFIQQGLINIGSMIKEELRSSIENPALLVGLEFETGLVNRILDHVANQPGSLPLLEFALAELWKKREGSRLTNEKYDEIGAVEGAISKRAEELFTGLSIDEQEVSLQLLSRLVRVAGPNEEGTDTRLRVKMSDLDISMRSAARSFVQGRLLVVDRDSKTNEETLEVAHEALIRRWDRLHELLNQNREFILWRRRLRLKLSEWQRTKDDDGLLLQGTALAEAKQWLKARKQDLIEDEKEYIRKSSRQDPKSDTWHHQFDLANYAIIATSLTLAFVFSSPHNTHFIIPIVSLLVTFLLFMEVSSYHLWIEALAEDLGWPKNPVSWWSAVGVRLRRNYLWIFTLLAGSWILKVYISPLPAEDFGVIVSRATISLIPGYITIVGSTLFYLGVLLCALSSTGKGYRTEEGNSLFQRINFVEANTKGTQWLEVINYVVFVTSATCAVVFSSPNNPHFIFIFNFVFITYFLFNEANHYWLWHRSMMKNVVASKYSISWAESMGLSLRRNYFWIFTIMGAGWILKIYLSPLPARDFDAFIERATIGIIPGWILLTFSLSFYIGLALFVLFKRPPDDEPLLSGIPLSEARQWLEKTTIFVLVSTLFTIVFLFGSPNNPHFVFVITSLFVGFLLFKGFNYYRLWTKALTLDSTASTYTKIGWKAVGLRLRRTYLLSFLLLFGCWILKIYLSPLPARDFDVFIERATVGIIDGWLFFISVIILHVAFVVFVLTTFRCEAELPGFMATTARK